MDYYDYYWIWYLVAAIILLLKLIFLLVWCFCIRPRAQRNRVQRQLAFERSQANRQFQYQSNLKLHF